jgi:hypothetical protein
LALLEHDAAGLPSDSEAVPNRARTAVTIVNERVVRDRLTFVQTFSMAGQFAIDRELGSTRLGSGLCLCFALALVLIGASKLGDRR